MKRLHIITKPTAVNDLAEMDADSYENDWELRAERLHVRRLRRFRQQLT